MTDLPGSGTFRTNNALTQGGLRSAHEDLRDYLAESPWGGSALIDPIAEPSAKIVADAITPLAKKSRFILLTPESGTSDNLATIGVVNIALGGWLILSVVAGNTVTLLNTGNIGLQFNDSQLQLNNDSMGIVLRRDGSSMKEVLRFGRETKRSVGSAGLPWGAGWSGTVKFWRDSNGTVCIEGFASHAPPGSGTVFTLPVGYRPSASRKFVVPTSNNGRDTVEVLANGNVSYLQVDDTGLGVVGYLDAVRFSMDA